MPVETVHSLAVHDRSGRERRLELAIGDVTEPDPQGTVDLLCISAFPDDYLPLPGTVIGRLAERGVRVDELARAKSRDWRDGWQSWISAPAPADSGIGRLVCFEHGEALSAPDVVGNVFRAVREFVLADRAGHLGVLRLPLLSTGDQRAPKREMLDAILRQAHTHLLLGLPVDCVQLVLPPHMPTLHSTLVDAGRVLASAEAEWAASQHPGAGDATSDFFVSYRHADRDRVQPVLEAIRRAHPDIRLFVDRERLSPGRHWKHDLLRGIAGARRMLCFITDGYPSSLECMDEFHAALLVARQRHAFLRPLALLEHTRIEALPGSIRRVHCIDARTPPRTLDDVVAEVFHAPPS